MTRTRLNINKLKALKALPVASAATVEQRRGKATRVAVMASAAASHSAAGKRRY